MTKHKHIEYGHSFKLDPNLAKGFKERQEFHRKRQREAFDYCFGTGSRPEWWDEMDFEE